MPRTEDLDAVLDSYPDLDIRLLTQSGTGKGDAIRAGFAAAKHDVLMIIDGDLSVLLELPKLRVLGMRDRREYRPRVAEIEEVLRARHDG